MKRLLGILLAITMLLGCVPTGLAEEDTDETYVPTATEIALYGRVVSDEPTHITVGNTTKVDGMFWTNQFGNNTSDIDVRYMLHGYNPIVWDTQLDFITDPLVVESLTTTTDSDGNSIYTFVLMQDLQWSDGSEITAEDYVFSYLLQASPELQAIGGDIDTWNYIVGYEAYAAGETDYLEGVHLLDKYSYSVTIKKEYLPYFYELSLLFINLSPKAVIAPGCMVEETKDGAGIVNIEVDTDPIFTAELLQTTILDPDTGFLSHPSVVSGPYRMTSYDRETGYVDFEINEYYKGNWEGVKPVITTVTLRPISPDNAAELLASGEVDLVNKAVRADMIQSCTELVGSGYTMENYARLGYGYLTFSTEKNCPVQFQKVRQAIACSFDTDYFVQEYLSGYGLTVDGYYGLGQWMTQAAYGNLRPSGITDEEALEWDAISLSVLDHYDLDLDRALNLLIEDGWVLNENGEPFDAEKDTLRYKDVDGELMALRIVFGKTANHAGADLAVSMLQESFKTLNAELVVEEAEYHDILVDHLRENEDRVWDMTFMAFNFVSIFDPLIDFNIEEDENGNLVGGTQNAGRIVDEELLQLAWDMHKTEPGDLLTYEQRWLAFQQRFNEVLPTMPIYSNIYFDFHTDWLHNYYPNAEFNWPVALIYSYVAEPEVEEEEPTEEGEETEDGDVFFE